MARIKVRSLHTLTAGLLALAALAPLPTAPVRAASPHGAARANRVDAATSDPRFGVVEAGSRDAIADSLGVRWTRIPFVWADVQPTGPGSWNPDYLGSRGSDAVIDGEVAQGRSVVGILGGTPAWAQEIPAYGRTSAPANLFKPWDSPANYWGAYCHRIARHYAGRIDAWIIYNEVSIPAGMSWTQWRGAMAEYARTLQVAYLAIHAANPAARVVMYGDPFWYDHGDYLRKLYPLLHRMDPGDRYHGYFDVANLHLYSNPAGMAGMIGWLRGELARYGWVNKQIWVGETNAEPYDDPATPRPRDNFRVSMGAQSSFMIDAFAELLAARVDRIEVYKMSDGADSDLGLVDCAGTLRPFARTYAFMGRLYQGVTDGVVTQGDRVDGKAGIFKVVLRAPGRRITVLWNQGGDTRVYRLRLGDPHPVRYTKYGDAMPIAVRSGAYTAVLGGNDDFTDPYDPRMPVVGGDPVIVVERTGR